MSLQKMYRKHPISLHREPENSLENASTGALGTARKRADGTPEGGWYPEHRVSLEAAVRAYTVLPARFLGMEHESISAVKLADMIVLDKNIYQIDPVFYKGTGSIEI